jgi:hypothetical protein
MSETRSTSWLWSPALAAILALTGCFDAPKPNCAFLCGPEQQCPAGYACSSDGRCHRVLPGGAGLAECEDTLTDAAISLDASVDPDATLADASPDPDASPDAGVPDAGVPDATPPQCTTPSQCGSDTECVTWACTSNMCVPSYTADQTPLATQTAGDCRVVVCNGTGGTRSDPDNADVPDDDDPTDCVVPICDGGAPSTQLKNVDESCGAGDDQHCTLGGDCVDCLAPQHCPDPEPANECRVADCLGDNTCGGADVAQGIEISAQTAGDCKKVVCDGNGGTEPVADPADVPDDPNPDDCMVPVCVGDTPGETEAPEGAACNQSGGSFCDGAGNCVECTEEEQCPIGDPCETPTCVANVCGVDTSGCPP